jgi:predicted SprT family Zn-dependent metalloprotease
MKTVKHEEKYFCDKCGKEITDTVYELTCYAFAVGYEDSHIQNIDSATQNITQNLSKTKQLCKECKNELTDGLFIK